MLGQTVGAHLREPCRGKSYTFVCHAVVCLKIGFVIAGLTPERSQLVVAPCLDMPPLLDHRYLEVAPLEKVARASSWTPRTLSGARAVKTVGEALTGLSGGW